MPADFFLPEFLPPVLHILGLRLWFSRLAQPTALRQTIVRKNLHTESVWRIPHSIDLIFDLNAID
jgi:hypothetical protein